jgi:hypothetical protein
MAHNNALYNAVIQGAGGSSNNRWLTDVVSADYLPLADAVAVIATAVDAAIAPIAGGPTQGQIDLLRTICQGVFEGRYPRKNFNYDSIAASMVAQFNELTTKLLPIVIQQPSIATAMTKYPTGFENRTTSTLGFVDGTRTFTITPIGSYNVWFHGERLTKTAPDSIVWDNVEGLQIIYFDGNGVIQKSTDPNVFQAVFSGDGIPIVAFYWDATNLIRIRTLEERHDISLPPSVHAYLHLYVGTVLVPVAGTLGGALGNFTITGGAGNADVDAQFSVSDHTVADEDIQVAIVNGAPQTLSPIAHIPIMYLQGAGVWRQKTADAFPLIYSGSDGYVGANGRIAWNQLLAGVWSLQQVTEGNFALVHFFGSTDAALPDFGVCGQAIYTSAALARTGADHEIITLRNLLGLLSTEKRALGSVIFQTATGYLNTPKAKVVVTDLGDNYVDWRPTPIFTGVVQR